MISRKILVVDDNKTIRRTIVQTLEALGHQLMSALDGSDALRQLEVEEYDLMLLDLKMPGMDGLQVLEKALKTQPNLPIMIISAHGTVDSAVEAMKLGAVDFLEKPFTPQELREKIYPILEVEIHHREETRNYKRAIKIAKFCASKRQYDKAIAHVKQAIGIDPSNPEAFNLLGEIHELSGERSEALKQYRVATDLDPTYKPAHNNLDRATRSPKSRPTRL
ncbi:sigma-54-dependent transcriptional regulator [Oscillatoria salina]|uniref:sigma-54-dependent transcriptional regulator n=1 Tax=Oscillatoria salina TaxID=331517 RepID=UPI001CCA26F0|nr:response regulator [Oscillatoria salina]MBZ8182416.1 response regulator [Oscillatoria salina IIICB1]